MLKFAPSTVYLSIYNNPNKCTALTLEVLLNSYQIWNQKYPYWPILEQKWASALIWTPTIYMPW